MSDPMVVRPIRRGRFAIPVLMLLLGVALGVGLDRAFMALGPVVKGRPNIIGRWESIPHKTLLEFNADGTTAYELATFKLEHGASGEVTGNRRLGKWRWLDGDNISYDPSFGSSDVKARVAFEGDTLKLIGEDGDVTEYRRKD